MKDAELPKEALVGIIACACYSGTSMAMTLVNKAIFAFFKFDYPMCLLLYQNIFTVLLLQAAKRYGYVTFKPLDWPTVKQWLPVNILFILMLTSGSYALKLLSIPMVTIFKNMTTALVTFGDNVMFGEQVTSGILTSVIVMVFGSIVAGFSDLEFNFAGYAWMSFNCFVSAAYILYIRFAIKKTQLSEWGMVYYNNLLSIPFILPLLFINSEMPSFLTEDKSTWTNSFIIMWFVSGVSSFLISVCSFWAVKATSPTTYSIVGTLNKIPLTVLGIVFFSAPISNLGAVSIAIGLSGGMLYSYEKNKLMKLKQEKAAALPTTKPQNEK